MIDRKNNVKVQKLIQKDVRICNSETISLGEEVPVEGISGDGVVIHSGSKIFGSTTVIAEGCEIGYEAPVTIEHCQSGHHVKLKGEYFSQSTF
jgi:bifunctional UDP-N-acetylglucosamine pyrophosphorylase/glucosamine-1-phosphate N-acetyltransferase